jgi:hypothetical protein
MIELVLHDREDEDYLCRKCAENHPFPTTFTRRNICVNVCTIVRRKRLVWVAPTPEPMTPPSPEEQRSRQAGHKAGKPTSAESVRI